MKSITYPARTILFGFLFLILIGTILLKLPIMLRNGQTLSLIDTLFMSTSAICVTGLSVVNISHIFSIYGQIVMLLLIQIGGLGYMTMTSSLFFIFGKKISMSSRLAIQSSIGHSSMEGLLDFIKYIIKVTIFIELIGAIILGFAWFKDYGYLAFYYGVFHSISAFCNAGFTLFKGSLSGSLNNNIVIFCVSILIVLGGLGFFVIANLINVIKKKEKLSYHSKLVISLSAFFIIIPAIVFLFIEYNNLMTIGSFKFSQKLLISFFHSITARTAGFNILNMSQTLIPNAFLMLVLMFIGASPGGTGGGIKTTTIAVVFSSIKAMFTKNKDAVMYKRRVKSEVVHRAWVITFLGLILISTVLFLLLLIEKKDFTSVLFEVVSAFGTVGLSLGITAKLSILGKLLIMITMFLGRLGPITVGMALYFSKTKSKFRYAEKEIMIG